MKDEFKNVIWTQGRTLLTSTTKRWTKEQWDSNEYVEKCCAFVHFSNRDNGKSRQLVAKFDTPEECEIAILDHNKGLFE